ncbi:MAG TPA: hypothetical protein VGI14_03075 [Casimicrobiaceae bacterium]|jgi:hypothetical protein
MRSSLRLCVLAVAGALLVSGCALRDPRDSYAYGRGSDGLWEADYDVLLDWNFPTSSNLGPVEAPQRFRPERPAIGVPWATGNPLHPLDAGQAPALDGPDAASAPSAHAGDGTPQNAATDASHAADGVGSVRDARLELRVTGR